MSQIKVDTITDEAGTGAPEFPSGVSLAGGELVGVASTAEAQAGALNTKVMTPAAVEQHMLANDMGRGGTVILPAYLPNTWYQNTQGRPVFLNVRTSGTAGSHTFWYGESTTVYQELQFGDGSSGTWNTLSLVWLPGWYLQFRFTPDISNYTWEVR